MISIIRELINYDKISFKYWFAKETLSKIIVATLFILIALGLSGALYFFSSGFFKYLFTFETYGQFTAVYILKASLLVVIWLGILSSFVSTLSFLLTPDKRIDHLFTQPIDIRGIVVYQNIKTLFLNFSIFVILILPMIYAYLQRSGVGLLASILRSVIVLINTVLIAEGLGSSVGYIIANRFKKKEGVFFTFITILLIVFLTFSLFKTILPNELKALYSSSSTNFTTLYQNLPLNKFCLINNNLTGILINGISMGSLTLILFTLFLSILSYQTQTILFKETWQRVRVNLENHLYIFKLKPKSLSYPSLVQKDVVSILRSPKEIGYGLFLFALLISFIALFSRGMEVNRIPERFSSSMVIFSWLWLSFYSITYFMRISFPSMSKEGKTRWWLFTLPIKPSNLINSKLYTSFLFTLPIFIIAVLEWWFVPFSKTHLFLSIISIISISTLMLVITIMGIIKPDYSLADDPEKVSTGVSGIFALTFSLMMSGFTAFIIYASITLKLPELLSINILILLFVISSAYLYYLGLATLKKHTLEIQ